MRPIPLRLATLTLALLAGCSSQETGDPFVDPATKELDSEYGIPADILETALLPVGLEAWCISSPCPKYSFTLAGNTTVAVLLSWNLPANDIDFYVFTDGDLVMEGAEVAPQTSERALATLPAGTYDIMIQPWHATTDEFTLQVNFARP